MPIYEFECGGCGERFESLVAADTAAADCPACGAAGAERRMSSFAPTTRQMTPAQRRRAEDARGTNRDGARTRFKQSLAKGRAKGSADRKKGP